MINASIIHTNIINAGSGTTGLDLECTLSCVSSVATVDMQIVKLLDTEINCVGTCVSDLTKYGAFTVTCFCECRTDVGLGTVRYQYVILPTDSTMLPTNMLRTLTKAGFDLDVTGSVLADPRFYRKGKPVINFNKYSIRRALGKIVILKDEYL